MSLRAQLLAGRRIALAAPAEDQLAQRLRELGAALAPLTDRDEQAAAEWVTAHAPLDALVYDARPVFADGGHARLRAALDEAWLCARAVATGALIASGRAGRLLFLAPAPDAGPLAEPARAGLESLARTLSVEWARHRLTAVAICPGAATTPEHTAELTAFLLSPAGGYYSGCRFDLGLPLAS